MIDYDLIENTLAFLETVVGMVGLAVILFTFACLLLTRPRSK